MRQVSLILINSLNLNILRTDNIVLNNIALGSKENELEFFQTSESSSSTFCKIDQKSNYFKRKKNILNFFHRKSIFGIRIN